VKDDPEMFTGVIRDGAIWTGGDDVADIPRIPEFDDESYRSIYMSRHLKGVNAMAFLEAGLDFEHIHSVHSIMVTDWFTPKVRIEHDLNSNTHVFETPSFRLRVETIFWLPLTNCLKFHFFDKKRKVKRKPFILFFSMTPHDANNVTLHVRSLRGKIARDLEPILDLFYTAVSDIPILEDARVVRNVDMSEIAHDHLSVQDEFIRLYRTKLGAECPNLMQYFTTQHV
jgi:hypothetical protein